MGNQTQKCNFLCGHGRVGADGSVDAVDGLDVPVDLVQVFPDVT